MNEINIGLKDMPEFRSLKQIYTEKLCYSIYKWSSFNWKQTIFESTIFIYKRIFATYKIAN